MKSLADKRRKSWILVERVRKELKESHPDIKNHDFSNVRPVDINWGNPGIFKGMSSTECVEMQEHAIRVAIEEIQKGV